MPTWLLDVLIVLMVLIFVGRRMLPTKGISVISTAELRNQLKDKKKQFVDVRTPGEYNSNHIREFKNIPLNTLSKRATELSKDKEVVVICQSGMRSNQASKMLKKMGFESVTNVKGGMSAW